MSSFVRRRLASGTPAWVIALGAAACNGPAAVKPPPSQTPPEPAAPAVASTPVTSPPPAPSESAAPSGVDPITRQIAKFDPYGLWTNGLSPKLDLPATASLDDVLTKMFAAVGFDRGHVKTFHVTLDREQKIGKDPRTYRALLVETDLGRKVVLLRYESEAVGWWSRVYDAE